MREGRSDRGPAATDRVDGVRIGASPNERAGDCPQLADTDEAAAGEARARYREHGLEPLEADEAIRGLLQPGEEVLAVRHSVALDRRVGSNRVSAIDSIRGDLYVTTARLVQLGRQTVTIALDEIEDFVLVGEKVLLVLRDGVGVALDVDRPRLLRAQISAARTARAGRADGPRLQSQAESR